MTDIALFDYDLPEAYIAQVPVEPRDSSRMMVVDRMTGAIVHRHFFDILDELRTGDVLVFNVSRVFRARLAFDGGEMFVLSIADGEAKVLLRPGKKFPIGSRLPFTDSFTVTDKQDDGVVTIATGKTTAEMFAYCEANGEVPTPPYVGQAIDEERYQTVYAKTTGSVAAPTAGLHFTPELLAKIREKGVQIEEVTLHVGLGTFRPVQTKTLEEHVMHEEWVEVTEATVERILQAKTEGRRIVAVGTTTVRVLEGVAAKAGNLVPYEGMLNAFITPGFTFRVIDGLITNFHLPKSTLLVLVAAFIASDSTGTGREKTLNAYENAKKEGYRFFSFGDAMFIR